MGVLRHSASGVVCFAHFDGSDMENLHITIENMVKRIKEVNNTLAVSDGQLELHLIGGFKDSRHYSDQLVIGLLSKSSSVHRALNG